MDDPLLLPFKETLQRPPGGGLYVKHFILTAKKNPLKPKVEGQPLPFSNSLITKVLISKGSPLEVWEKLITVQFESYTEDKIRDILAKNVGYNGTVYQFLGFSSAQLKKKTCCFLSAQDKEAPNLLEQPHVSSFARIEQKATANQRLFQPFEKCLQLGKHEVTCNVPATDETVDLIYPMSIELAKRIQTECELPEIPSVVQFVCKEFSGALVYFPKGDDGVQVGFTTPVSPVDCSSNRTVGIVECSRPYTMGYLDLISMKLLVERGISHKYFSIRQNHNLLVLKNLEDPTYAKYFLHQIGEQNLLKKIENRISDEEHSELIRIRSEEIRKLEGRNMSNFRVFVPQSREVFGIKDPDQNGLKSDECVFSATLHSKEEKDKFKSAKEVVVILQPCYKAEHIVKLRLVRDKDNYNHLKDCIVLPFDFASHTSAKKYFVSWDRDLIPQANWNLWDVMPGVGGLLRSCLPRTRQFIQTRCLNQAKAKASHISTGEEMQRYFAKLTIINPEELVPLAESVFLEESNIKGPSCHACQELGKFLSPDFDWYENGEKAKEYLNSFKHPKSGSRTEDDPGKKSSDVDLESDGEHGESNKLLAEDTSVSQDVWGEMKKELQDFIKNVEAGTNSSQE